MADLKLFEEKMQKSISVLEADLATLRAGRANPAVLNKITVEYYGAVTPVAQIGSISTTVAPVSSYNSLLAASNQVSPSSMCPPGISQVFRSLCFEYTHFPSYIETQTTLVNSESSTLFNSKCQPSCKNGFLSIIQIGLNTASK